MLPEVAGSSHPYRTHTCGALDRSNDGEAVRLSGWCHRIRRLGGVAFLDLRDHYGITQVLVEPGSAAFPALSGLVPETVVRVDGTARRRPAGTENPDLATGEVEVAASAIEVLGAVQTTSTTQAEVLGAVQVNGELPYTGSETTGLAVAGLIVTGGGAALVALARSRARHAVRS